jgi:DNA-binding SARP family transcriptional activator/TolB-like protein
MRQIMTAIVVKQRQARARLFGDVRVFSDAGLPLEIGSRRARAMLGYLSMTPERAATRSRLCGLFWGERGEIQARASLRQCLREIRGATEHLDLALIGSDGERVVLVPGVLDTDVHELSSAFETEDATAARQILETIGTARLMEGLELEGSFREWLDQARARTEHVLSSGILALLKSLEARADWQTAQSLADTYLTRDPFDEAVVAMAIRADAALGNNASARRRFRNLEEALNREFRVRPGASARDAIAALSREGEASAREPDTASFEGSAALSAGPPTVVVAGFVSDGDSPADQKLTAILRDEILAGLAHFHDLRVVAEPRSLNEMAQDLHARPTSAYALGGTLRSFGESRRLTVQLLRGGAGELVWSRRYELPRLEFIGAIDEIIAPVVAAVVPTITSDMNRSPPSETADQAYERHLLTLGPDAKARDYEQARAAAASLEAMISADRKAVPAAIVSLQYGLRPFASLEQRTGATRPGPRPGQGGPRPGSKKCACLHRRRLVLSATPAMGRRQRILRTGPGPEPVSCPANDGGRFWPPLSWRCRARPKNVGSLPPHQSSADRRFLQRPCADLDRSGRVRACLELSRTHRQAEDLGKSLWPGMRGTDWPGNRRKTRYLPRSGETYLAARDFDDDGHPGRLD